VTTTSPLLWATTTTTTGQQVLVAPAWLHRRLKFRHQSSQQPPVLRLHQRFRSRHHPSPCSSSTQGQVLVSFVPCLGSCASTSSVELQSGIGMCIGSEVGVSCAHAILSGCLPDVPCSSTAQFCCLGVCAMLPCACAVRDAAVQVARAIPVPPGGAGDAPGPDVPLPVRGGTAPRHERIHPPLPLTADCCRDFLEEGRRITKHGKDVLFLHGVLSCPPSLIHCDHCATSPTRCMG
jgi:hypothetical protein